MKKKVLFFLLVLGIVPVVAADLAVSPVRFCFEQGMMSESYELKDMFCNETIQTYYPGNIFKNNICIKSDTNVRVYLQGDLSEFITLSQTEITAPLNTTCIEYQFKLPSRDELTIYGELKTLIYVETKMDPSAPGMVISTRMGQEIIVSVPYPEIYLKPKLTINASTTRYPVQFTVELNNFGRTALPDVSGQINITENSSLVESLPILSTPLAVGESTTKTIEWDAKAGNYTATLSVVYAGKTATILQNFTVQRNPWRFSLSRLAVSILTLTMFLIILLAIVVAIYYARSKKKYGK